MDNNSVNNISDSVLFLTSIESIGYKAIDKLINCFGSIDNVYKASEIEILFCGELTEKQKNDFIQQKKQWNPDRYRKYLINNKINIVTRYDKDYPSKLNDISDPPFQLFYIGDLPDENISAVSIIGARNCSEYGKSVAKYFAKELALNGIQIVSGLASGIDGISQNEAIENGGKSFGILGSGVDICYPNSNIKLYNSLKINGGVISEFPVSSKPLAYHFPMRNRIISGLADIVIVVEAREKSGTAITVNMALEQGREVFAVPGRINDALSMGCNKLICEGAGIAKDVDSILDALNIKASTRNKLVINNIITQIQNSNKLSDISKKIAVILNENPMTIDELYSLINKNEYCISIQEIQMACFELKLLNYTYEENMKIGIKTF